jgi:transglutaminase-like putative cysteine protease
MVRPATIKKMVSWKRKYGISMEKPMMQSIIKIKLIVTFLAVVSCPITAQISYNEYQSLREKHKGESVVKLNDAKKYTLNINKGELEIYEETESRYLFLKNTSGEAFTHSIYTSEFTELIDYQAATYALAGEKYKKIHVKEYATKTNSGSSSFYDDVKELVFTFPAVTVGSVVEFKTREKIKESRLLGTVFLNSYYPTEVKRVEYNFDSGINLDVIKYNGNEKFEIVEESSKNRRILLVELYDQPATLLEDNAPNIRYYLPHLIPIIRSYSYKDSTTEILADNSSLYKWYFSLIGQSKEGIETDAIKHLADSLTAGYSTELEKVEKLYYWVQKNVQYIAFEYGMGGFVPRKPDEILHKRYGDCKDKSSLLHELTYQAGITTYFTWIGTRDLPYSYKEVSSPVSDNHMLLTYIDADSNFYFLDATARFNHISFPTAFTQGKEAMIGINNSDFIIKKVPVINAQRNHVVDNTSIKVEDSKLKGKGKMQLDGQNYIEAMYYLTQSDEEDVKEYLESMLSIGNNKFRLVDYNFPEIAEMDTTITIDYEFELDNYIQSYGDEIYINLNLNKDFLGLKIDGDRKFPLNLEYHASVEYNYAFDIPEGYEIKTIPKVTRFKHEIADYNISYRHTNNTLKYQHQISVNTGMVTKDLFDGWRALFSSIEKDYRQSVVLTKKK